MMSEDEITPVNEILNVSDKLQEVLSANASGNNSSYMVDTMDKINHFMEKGELYMSYLNTVMDCQAVISKKLTRIQKHQRILENMMGKSMAKSADGDAEGVGSKAIASVRTEIQLVNRNILKVQTESEKAHGKLDWMQKSLNDLLAEMRKKLDFTLLSIGGTGAVCGNTINPAETIFNSCDNGSA
ncbi:hypothetical protein FB639_006504 [Coemansia asiatica]|nr:hypothetical protein FB639_006504 [Coemansia asiatica]